MTKSCTILDLDAFEATKSGVEADPTAGQGAFQTTTTWEDGARARTVARSFTIETDEPAPLGGTDQAVDPMELLLASVGTCLTIGWVTNAVRRGVDFRDLRIDVSGDYDLRGYLGIDETRPGFGSISLHRPRRHRRRRCNAGGHPHGRRGGVADGRQRCQPHAAARLGPANRLNPHRSPTFPRRIHRPQRRTRPQRQATPTEEQPEVPAIAQAPTAPYRADIFTWGTARKCRLMSPGSAVPDRHRRPRRRAGVQVLLRCAVAVRSVTRLGGFGHEQMPISPRTAI
jgi:putative redox protein